ncbi:AraC family transcriptional regulator [Millisia brevis]|uniref:AraC family transcriptional regulator n=1 Tax=Millisia brevis TaxID=264148 RepID=UPI0008310336|nr:AraC family transcriptional regulator [Millisia brevis]
MSGGRFTVDPAMRAFIADLRLSARAVLRSADLPDDLFTREPVELSPDEYYRLWSALDRESGDRRLAVDVGAAISVETFSPPILAALSSPNLAVAARRVADFKPLIGPLRLDLAETADDLVITYHWPDRSEPPELLATSELVFWTALARIGTRRRIRPAGVTVPRMPSDRVALEEYFGARLTGGDAYAIGFRAADIRAPFLTESETMWRILAPELRRRLADVEAADRVSQQVRAVLVETLAAGDSSMGTIAARLAVSPRTLQRQLRDEGRTYSSVLAATREELARTYLHRDGLRTAEIAYLLGYDDTTSFYRAFRGWTGTTPESVRAEALSDS